MSIMCSDQILYILFWERKSKFICRWNKVNWSSASATERDFLSTKKIIKMTIAKTERSKEGERNSEEK